jgi:hypothetical protein
MWFELDTVLSGTYEVMNVLEEHFGSVYTGHQMMEAVGPGHNVCADHVDYTVP